jgi:hypothetical protein
MIELGADEPAARTIFSSRLTSRLAALQLDCSAGSMLANVLGSFSPQTTSTMCSQWKSVSGKEEILSPISAVNATTINVIHVNLTSNFLSTLDRREWHLAARVLRDNQRPDA